MFKVKLRKRNLPLKLHGIVQTIALSMQCIARMSQVKVIESLYAKIGTAHKYE